MRHHQLKSDQTLPLNHESSQGGWQGIIFETTNGGDNFFVLHFGRANTINYDILEIFQGLLFFDIFNETGEIM